MAASSPSVTSKRPVFSRSLGKVECLVAVAVVLPLAAREEVDPGTAGGLLLGQGRGGPGSRSDIEPRCRRSGFDSPCWLLVLEARACGENTVARLDSPDRATTFLEVG